MDKHSKNSEDSDLYNYAHFFVFYQSLYYKAKRLMGNLVVYWFGPLVWRSWSWIG